MVLHIPLAADAFYEYLDSLEDQQAPIFFALYADLRHYDRACTQEEDDQSKFDIANSIYNEYVEDGAQYYIQINPDVKSAIRQKFNGLM